MTIETLTRETTGSPEGDQFPVPQVENVDSPGTPMVLKGKNNAADSGIVGDSGVRLEIDSDHRIPANSHIADGANVSQGQTTDTAYAGSGPGTLVSLLKGIYSKLAGTLTVSGPVTDTELRATPLDVNITGTPLDVNITDLSIEVTGTLTDTQLRASPVEVTITEEDDTSGLPVTEQPIIGSSILPAFQFDTGEMGTIDTNLAKVFGSNPVVDTNGRLITTTLPDLVVYSNIYTAQSVASLNLQGRPNAIIQLFGTWAGTITFEATVNNADWIGFFGFNTGGVGAPVGTTTASGIFRFNTAGITAIRVRYTAYTSGVCQVYMVGTSLASIDGPGTVAVSGVSGTVTISGAVTEATLDGMLAPIAKPGYIAPTAPTLQTAGVAPYAYLTPQIVTRLRTEAAGSERLPFNQIPVKNDMSVQDVPLFQMMEKVWLQLALNNQLFMAVNNINPPPGWETIS